jgi:iron complex outermembrane receptor protein
LWDDRITERQKTFTPKDRLMPLYSGFIQDQVIIVPERIDLTLGTKILHNTFTGFEFHPSIRLAWTPDVVHTIWGSVSQGVRTPSRLERDYKPEILGSFGEFKSEKVIAYELGYRVRPRENIYISLAGFYNDYSHLRSIDTNYTPPPAFYFANNLEAVTYGVEFSGKYIATDWWKIRGGYTWLKEEFTLKSKSTYPQTAEFEAIDPENHALIQSLVDLGEHFQFDVTLRYADALPAALGIPGASSYFTFDVRLAWYYKWIMFAVNGSNLAEKTHDSAGLIEIPRSGFAQLSVRF